MCAGIFSCVNTEMFSHAVFFPEDKFSFPVDNSVIFSSFATSLQHRSRDAHGCSEVIC